MNLYVAPSLQQMILSTVCLISSIGRRIRGESIHIH